MGAHRVVSGSYGEVTRRGSRSILAAALVVALARAGLSAQVRQVESESHVSEVTVMPDRAVVTRRFEAELPEGRTVMVVDDLLPGLDERTLKCLPAAMREDVHVVDVSSEIHERPAPAHVKLASLEAQKARVGREIRAREDEIVTLKERGRVLGEYRTMTTQAMKLGLDKAPGPQIWKKAIEYISSRAFETTRKIRAVESRKFRHSETTREINAKIASIKKASGRKVRRVRIAVDCAAPGRKEFDLSYLVTGGVKWGPRYDVRLDRNAGRVELASLAAVTQETGEDWSDAMLTFSTRLPAKGLRPPEVSPVFLDAVERVDRRASASMVEVEEDESLVEKPSASASTKSLAYVGAAGGPPAVGAAPKAAAKSAHTIAEIRSGGEAVEFIATERVTVRTDGQPVTVALGRWETDCRWGYEAVPKILASVYVRAVFPNPTSALMLPGPGDCYLDGSYIGRMEVPSTPDGAEVKMSFGAVESLSVSRAAGPLTSERGRGGRRVYSYAYTMDLSNSGKEAAHITVLDNVPVSTIEAINVEVEPGTTPYKELDGGRVRWLVELAPGRHKKVRLQYRVEIAKNYRY